MVGTPISTTSFGFPGREERSAGLRFASSHADLTIQQTGLPCTNVSWGAGRMSGGGTSETVRLMRATVSLLGWTRRSSANPGPTLLTLGV